MNQAQQPEALRLANLLPHCESSVEAKAATELRRLHARVQELEGLQKRIPLTETEINELYDQNYSHDQSAGQYFVEIIRMAERAHDITAQPEYHTDDERDHSDEDAAISAGKIQAAVQGRTA